jgi:YVTN family beta-propeller protein
MTTRAALLFLPCLLLAGLATAQNPQPVPLVTGKAITPEGTQTDVGSFPANILLSPDGKFVVVTNTGFRQYLSVLSVETGKVVSRIEVGKARSNDKAGLYYGLAFDAYAKPPVLYAARGAEESVAVYTLGTGGTLTDTGQRLSAPSPVPDKKSPNHIAGIALSGGGGRLFAANNHTSQQTELKGELTIFDTSTRKPLGTVRLPGFPFGVACVTNSPLTQGKHKPFVYVTSERDGVVSVVDPSEQKVVKEIATGASPTALLLDRSQKRLFVANSGSDTVSIIDTVTDRVTRTILLRPDDARGLPGATPTGMALSPDEKMLYVTLADMNAVGVVDLDDGKLEGYIPVGWYPTSVVVSPDGRQLFVANAKGINTRNPNGKDVGEHGKYIQNIIEGTVSTIPVPAQGDLSRLTAQTLLNNRVAVARQRPSSLLKNPGIEHVIYIIKENRTYDQVLGDLPQGNGDPSLCMFPREVTPNQHALAERFVLLDNFYCCAEVSADGWNWSTAGMANEYVARNAPYNYSGRGKTYDFEGQNNGVPVDLLGLKDVATAPGGYIWDAVIKKGLAMRNYGFFVSFVDPATRGKEGDRAAAEENVPNKKALEGRTDTDFRLYDNNYADSEAWVLHNTPHAKQLKSYGKFNAPSRFTEWKREFDAYVKSGKMPRFMTIRLGNDHTMGTTPGAPSPRAMVADNDFAVGQLVEAVSNSPFWKKTAIFIVEDDAQNGFDHVDAHRSIAFVISPFVKKATVDSRFYNTDSVLRTMGLLLGTPPMSQYDAVAPPLAVFGIKAENDAPYKAMLPAKRIVGEINKATAYRAADSAKLDFATADTIDDDLLNDILWHSVMGKDALKPSLRYGLRLHAGEEEAEEKAKR